MHFICYYPLCMAPVVASRSRCSRCVFSSSMAIFVRFLDLGRFLDLDLDFDLEARRDAATSPSVPCTTVAASSKALSLRDAFEPPLRGGVPSGCAPAPRSAAGARRFSISSPASSFGYATSMSASPQPSASSSPPPAPPSAQVIAPLARPSWPVATPATPASTATMPRASRLSCNSASVERNRTDDGAPAAVITALGSATNAVACGRATGGEVGSGGAGGDDDTGAAVDGDPWSVCPLRAARLDLELAFALVAVC